MQSFSAAAAQGTSVPVLADSGSSRRSGFGSVLDVLIVEDDEAVRGACAGIAENFGCRVRTAASVPEARELLLARSFDVAFLDMRLPGEAGTTLFEEIRSATPRTFVVMMTAFASVSAAVDLMRNGAADFLPKPFTLDQITAVLQRSAERRQWSDGSRSLEDRLGAGVAAGTLVGNSPAMRRLFRILSKVALTRHPVLITGEHGTGKEIVARAIHANGPHALSSFLPIDCDCLDPAHLEAELFGPGDALASGPGAEGLFTAVGDGTVLLKEIGALSLAGQARLLRLLESRQLRTGSDANTPLRARLLASSNLNLEALVASGQFRKDLFYRLNVVHLHVPPLRERREDVVPLAELFLEQHRRDRQVPFAFSEHALDSLESYDWPDNVAELRTLVEHACSLSSESVLHFDDLSTQIRSATLAEQADAPTTAAATALPMLTLQELEKQAIQQSLRQLNGDKILAARVLGIGKTTLYRKLKEYGLADDAA